MPFQHEYIIIELTKERILKVCQIEEMNSNKQKKENIVTGLTHPEAITKYHQMACQQQKFISHSSGIW